jgi:aldehyde dehydrogenase (NAD+)
VSLVHATPEADVAGVVGAARAAFTGGTPQTLRWRLAVLGALADALRRDEERLLDALAADLGKPRPEAWFTEIGVTIAEIEHAVDNLAVWVKPEKVATPLALHPGSSRIVREPRGVVAIIAPWNYPVQLTLGPLVGALAAGNAAVVKPSELAPHSAAAIGDLLTELGEPAVQVVQGGVEQTSALLAERLDHILYTGNGRVGRIVAHAAAEQLTSVTLELGGKSPAVISRHADIAVSARRIAWGRFVNAGQTCVAPDYALFERPVHDAFVAALGEAIHGFYGADPQASADFGRIVDDAHFQRVEKLLGCGTVAVGGQSDPHQRYIAPTVLTGVRPDDAVMAEEIFGPILPILRVDTVEEAIEFINARPHPLAAYLFTDKPRYHRAFEERVTAGGMAFDVALLQVGLPTLPFGGVGPSGMGSYHGRAGFETFSQLRPALTKTDQVDTLKAVYPPYTWAKRQAIKRLL